MEDHEPQKQLDDKERDEQSAPDAEELDEHVKSRDAADPSRNPAQLLAEKFGPRGTAFALAGVVALVVLAVVLVVVFGPKPSSSSTSTAEGSGQAAPQNESSEAVTASAPEQRVYGSGKLDNIDPSWLDVNKIPTIKALTEAEGWQLETMLQQQGWGFDVSLEWLVDPLDAGLSLTGTNGRYDDQAIAALPAGGGASPVVYLLTVPASVYKTAEAAFQEVAKVTVEQQQWVDDTGVAVVVASNQVKYFVLCVPDANGKYHSIMVFNTAALEAGMFDSLSGGSYGVTPNEVMSGMIAGMVASTAPAPAEPAPAPASAPAPVEPIAEPAVEE